MKYLSLDTEATGLEEDCYLIQLAIVPVDTETRTIFMDQAFSTLVHCPSFDELKDKLNPWVLAHNEGLIRQANSQGISLMEVKTKLQQYLEGLGWWASEGKAILLGKSLSALDLPLLHRSFGWDFMRKYFHHHTLDITCVARALVDSKKLPAGCQSTGKLIKHFKVRETAAHTALEDAHDMAAIYFKLLDLIYSSSESK